MSATYRRAGSLLSKWPTGEPVACVLMSAHDNVMMRSQAGLHHALLVNLAYAFQTHDHVVLVIDLCSGAISARSRRDLGVISARSRRHLGAISASSWRDLGVISAES